MGEAKFKRARDDNRRDEKERNIRNMWEHVLSIASDPVIKEVLELHAPNPCLAYAQPDPYVYSHSDCRGCEFEAGYDSGPPEFPCATVRLIAEKLGVHIP